eukprot:gene8418-243_t
MVNILIKVLPWLFAPAVIGGARYLYPKKDYSDLDNSFPLTENVTVHRHHFQMSWMKINMSSNSVVVKTQNGDVVVYNPTEPDEKLKSLISLSEGKNLYCIFPNKAHFKFFDNIVAEYPEVQILVSSEDTLEIAKENVDEDSEYDKDNNIKVLNQELFETLPFKKEFDFQNIGGMDKLDEIVLYHKPSKALLTCDTLFNVDGATAPTNPLGFSLATLGWRALGIYDKGIAIPSFWKSSLLTDSDTFKQSWNDVYQKFDFSTVVMAHGNPVIKQNVREDVTNALKTFLKEK